MSDRQFQVAEQLQRGLIPASIPHVYSLSVAALSVPAQKVGGDFYDFIPHKTGAFDFIVGDVIGKGFAAALVVAMAEDAFRAAVTDDMPAADVLDHVNRLLFQRLAKRRFVATTYGHVLPRSSEVHLFNAGQQPLLYTAEKGTCVEVSAGGNTYPLGITDVGGYEPCRLTLAQDDILVCFSDGIPETVNSRGETFSYARLSDAVCEAAAAEPGQIISRVFQAALDFALGCEQADDLTMVVIKGNREQKGQEIDLADRPLIGELRPVALFAVQSLEGGEPAALKATDWVRIQAEVDRHGGVSDLLSSDTLVACFGLSDVHEDDAERAILTGREIEAILGGSGVALRSGFNVGNVVASPDGTIDYSLMGPTLSEALRLLNEAPPGTARLSEGVFQRLEGRLMLPTPERVEDGFRTHAFPSLQAVRRGRRYARLNDSVYVGRRRELRRLQDAWRRSRSRCGVPTIVSILGEAGVGKSRLVVEFLRRREPERVLRAHMRPYPPESGGLFASLIRNWLQVEEETQETQLRRLDEALEQLGDPRLLEAAPFLRSLVGFRPELPQLMDPMQYVPGLVAAVLLLIEVHALQIPEDGDPIVLVLEDLHWIDSVSAVVLTALCQQLAVDRGVLLIATSRLQEEALVDFSSMRRCVCMALGSLDEDETEEWIQHALRSAQLSPGIQRTLRSHAGGHPLFIEELIRYLRDRDLLFVDDGVWKLTTADWDTPDTLDGLIRSRLSQLGEAPSQLLRQASAIGETFSDDLLAAVVGSQDSSFPHEDLDELVAQGFIVRREGGHGYAFRHVLIRQAIYESLLPEDRAWLHGRSARAMEEHFPESAETQPEVLAHHFTEAGLRAESIPYWQRAGQRAIESSALLETITHLTRGLAVLETLPQTSARNQQELVMLTTLGPALLATRGFAAPQVEQTYARALELWHMVGDRSQLFPVLRGLWEFYEVRAELKRACELGEQLYELAESSGDSGFRVTALDVMGDTVFYLGEFSRAIGYLQEGEALYDREQHHELAYLFGGYDIGVAIRCYLAMTQCLRGYPDRGLQWMSEADSLVEQLSHPFSQSIALVIGAMVHQFRREAQATQERAQQLIAVATEQEFPVWIGAGNILHGWSLAQQGQTRQGIDQVREGLQIFEMTGAALHLKTQHFALLVESLQKAGHVEAGLEVLDESFASVEDSGERFYEAELFRLKGELLQEQNSDDGHIERCFSQAIDIARHQEAKWWELRATVSLSRWYRQQGRTDDARGALADIQRWFSEGYHTADMADARALLRELA